MEETYSFAGPWVGETMNHDSPAHLWEIELRGQYASVHTKWEGGQHKTSFSGRLTDDGREIVFTFYDDSPVDDEIVKRAIPVGPQHFVIEAWDTNDVRNNEGPDYDVVFSRPGVAELRAHDIYRRYLEMRDTRPSNAISIDEPGDPPQPLHHAGADFLVATRTAIGNLR